MGDCVLPTDAVRAVSVALAALLGRERLEEGVAQRVCHGDAVGGVVLQHALDQVEQVAVVGLVHCHVSLQDIKNMK